MTAHDDGQQRLDGILRYKLKLENVSMEKEVRLIDNNGVEYRAVYDNYGEMSIFDDLAVGIEIDGDVGHTSRQAQGQDKSRDRASMVGTVAGTNGKKKVIMVRLRTEWVSGRKALKDDVIVDQIKATITQETGLVVI